MFTKHRSASTGTRRARIVLPASLATLALVTGCSGGFGGEGEAGNYPSRPVTFSVGSEPGSGWDRQVRVAPYTWGPDGAMVVTPDELSLPAQRTAARAELPTA